MKTNLFFILIISTSIFITSACKKCPEKTISTAKLTLTFNQPNYSYPINYPAGSDATFTLKDTSGIYIISNDSTLAYRTGTAPFLSSQIFELEEGYYTIKVPITYESITPGFPPFIENFLWYDTKHIKLEKGINMSLSMH